MKQTSIKDYLRKMKRSQRIADKNVSPKKEKVEEIIIDDDECPSLTNLKCIKEALEMSSEENSQ